MAITTQISGETLEITSGPDDEIDQTPLSEKVLSGTGVDSQYVEVTGDSRKFQQSRDTRRRRLRRHSSFTISPDCPADSVIELDLRMGYGIGQVIFADSIKMALGSSPEIQVLGHRIYDYVGNGDEMPNPGELIVVLPTLTNAGNAAATDVRMRVLREQPLCQCERRLIMPTSTATAPRSACLAGTDH